MHGFLECVLINDGKKNDISITPCGFVAFYGKINDSIKLQKENSVMQQDLTSPILEADIHIISHVSQVTREKSNNIIILLKYCHIIK